VFLDFFSPSDLLGGPLTSKMDVETASDLPPDVWTWTHPSSYFTPPPFFFCCSSLDRPSIFDTGSTAQLVPPISAGVIPLSSDLP